MILVDKNIKELSAEGKLIKEAYTEENVNSISYDLTLGSFADKAETEKKLIPGATVIIKTKEKLSIPDNITGRVGEKNSLLRMGLKVDGPQYQPGHTTYAFLRIQNISADEITLKVGMHIAQIYFEELKERPEKTYAEQENASFQNEDEYRHFGKYEEAYRKNIKAFEKMQDIKENIERRHAAWATGPETGIRMEVLTTLPGMHLYTANYLAPKTACKDDARYDTKSL